VHPVLHVSRALAPASYYYTVCCFAAASFLLHTLLGNPGLLVQRKVPPCGEYGWEGLIHMLMGLARLFYTSAGSFGNPRAGHLPSSNLLLCVLLSGRRFTRWSNAHGAGLRIRVVLMPPRPVSSNGTLEVLPHLEGLCHPPLPVH
jgi:hypothetical protein